MADNQESENERESSIQTPSEHRAYHVAEQELQDHIIDIYGASSGNDDMFRWERSY